MNDMLRNCVPCLVKNQVLVQRFFITYFIFCFLCILCPADKFEYECFKQTLFFILCIAVKAGIAWAFASLLVLSLKRLQICNCWRIYFSGLSRYWDYFLIWLLIPSNSIFSLFLFQLLVWFSLKIDTVTWLITMCRPTHFWEKLMTVSLFMKIFSYFHYYSLNCTFFFVD